MFLRDARQGKRKAVRRLPWGTGWKRPLCRSLGLAPYEQGTPVAGLLLASTSNATGVNCGQREAESVRESYPL
jgi:hypothetical protein